MSSKPALQKLGKYLTVLETNRIIGLLEAGETTRRALEGLDSSRKTVVKDLLGEADLGRGAEQQLLAVLYGIAGAHSQRTPITPVWTQPGHLADSSLITVGAESFIRGARSSVVCATYNFQQSSSMEAALKEVSEEYNVHVTIYVDGAVGDPSSVQRRLPRATVFGSGKNTGGHHIKSHAKFISVDHQEIYITSANLSRSAERFNVELGLRVKDSVLVESVEKEMRDLQRVVYQRAVRS